MTILGRAQNVRSQIDVPELRHIIHHDQIGIEVDYAPDAGRQEIGQVHPRVIEGLVESSADGVRDLSPDDVGVKVVKVEVEVRERGGDNPEELRLAVRGGDEVEHHILRARGVLQHREYARDGAAEVGGIESHGYVDDGRVVNSLVGGGPCHFGTSPAVSKCRCFPERGKLAVTRRRRKTDGGGDDEGEDCGAGVECR